MKTRWMSLGCLLMVGLVACEEKQEGSETKVEAVTAEPTPVASPEVQKPSEEEKEAEAEEAEQRAEAEKAQAEVEANPLTECCRALGQKAFTLRSPEYHGASKACGEAMTEEKGMGEVLPAIKKALKSQPLPDACQGD